MEEIDLKEIFLVFWEKKTTIILLVAIFMVLGYIYSAFILVPKYKSYTTLLLAQSATSGEDSAITTSDLTLNSNLISTYSDLVTSNTVIRKVISNLGIDDSEDSIKNNISVSAEKGNNIMKITVTNVEPQKAANIANEIAQVFMEQARERFNVSNVYTVDEAEVNYNPYNVNHIKDIIIFALIGFVIAAGYIFVVFMLDNSIKSQDDVEKNVHVAVLANIPIYETDPKLATKTKNPKKQKSSKGGKKR